MTTASNSETRGFETEVNQLLDLMIHSLYSNKDIFLRELISNASDACDRLRFSAISNADLYEQDIELKIRVAYDKENRTVTISDNGIGMTRDEVIEHNYIFAVIHTGPHDVGADVTGTASHQYSHTSTPSNFSMYLPLAMSLARLLMREQFFVQ